MKFTLLTPLVFLFLCLVPAQAQEDMPYIYYFDSVAGGMVVERADGSDSRVFEGVYAPVTWSPSGEWFVTIQENRLLRGRADGTELVELLTTENNGFFMMKFAPNKDVLAIMEQFNPVDTRFMHKAHITLVDVPQAKLLATVQSEEINTDYVDFFAQDRHIFWDDTGEAAYFDTHDILYILTVDGKIRVQQLLDMYSNQNAMKVFHRNFLLPIEEPMALSVH